MDCRQYPNDYNCTLTISGEEPEVLKAAVLHAVQTHGEKDTPEFRAQLKTMLADEMPTPMGEAKRTQPRATV